MSMGIPGIIIMALIIMNNGSYDACYLTIRPCSGERDSQNLTTCSENSISPPARRTVSHHLLGEQYLTTCSENSISPPARRTVSHHLLGESISPPARRTVSHHLLGEQYLTTCSENSISPPARRTVSHHLLGALGGNLVCVTRTPSC